MKIISPKSCLYHETGKGHPESQERFIAVEHALRVKGLLNEQTELLSSKATLHDLTLCHSPSYIHKVINEISALKKDEIKILSTGDVCIAHGSLDSALSGVGAALAAVDAIVNGLTEKIFVNTRPPGHHASKDAGMGFCIFNNIAFCALRILTTTPIKKILIIDFDVHHGNGTQDIFYEDPRVFYFSIHQEGIYPGTGFSDETGYGEGVGTTLNCPILPTSSSENEAMRAFHKLKKAMESYQPEFVLISAGFDAHELDPLGNLKFKTETYRWITSEALALAERYANGKLISILEGGYNLKALPLCVVAHVEMF